MTFCYALVCNGETPLCQYCAVSGNFDLYYQKFLSKAESNEDITLFKSDGYIWGIKKTSEDLSFLCVVRDDCDNDIIVKILNEIRNKFLKNYASIWKDATRFSLQSAFEPFLIEISNLVPQKALTLNEIVVPNSFNEIESSDTEEFLLRSSFKSPSKRAISWESFTNGLKKHKYHILIALIVIIFIIYFILTIYCESFTLSGCGIKSEGAADGPVG